MLVNQHSDNKTYQNMKGSKFIFHLFSYHNFREKEPICIGLSSINGDYVYPPTNKDELKELADFIYKYLENN